MKSFIAACPACAAPVEFHVSESLVTVCEFCHSVVGRTNKKLEEHGKVSDLVQSRSPLQLGLKGQFNGKKFEIIGRVQYRHSAGGVWDEWYLTFPGGKVGWLAEAQGAFLLTFERPVSKDSPSFEELTPGTRVALSKSGDAFTVVEKGVAKTGSAEGEIPWPFRPNVDHVYVDLHGEKGAFGTVDFNQTPPRVFVGRTVTLDELHIADLAPENKGVQRTSSAQLNCPNCAGPLTLFAPDDAQRVTCPNCRALLDVEQGNLKFLKTLKQKTKPVIPIGSLGQLRGTEFTVIGFMERYVLYEGTAYPWTEYLLYQPRVGFRWLVNSDNHWSYVEPVSAGDVTRDDRIARFRGTAFKIFQHGVAHVRCVLGEFYWRVEVGERTLTRDYVAPPLMLTVEMPEWETVPAGTKSLLEQASGGHLTTQEMIYSLGTYLPHEEVEAAFGITDLKRAWKVAPNQPAPRSKPIFVTWLLTMMILLLADFALSNGLAKTAVDQWWLVYSLLTVSAVPVGTLIYLHNFEVQRWSDSDYSPYATGDDE